MNDFFVVVNPAAGGGSCGRRAAGALARLRQSGLALEVHYTQAAGQATEMVREARRRGVRRFLAVGGDGTSYEMINGLFPNEEGPPPVLGLLPLGTGNSFLRDFRIDGLETAESALVRGATRQCDVIRVTHSDGVLHYINLLSVGFSAEAGELTNRRFKALGTGGYIAAVVAKAVGLRCPVFPVQLDSGSEDKRPCVLLSFSNSRFTGGQMMMAPDADPTDGMLDIIRVGAMGTFELLKCFPLIFRGEHLNHPAVEARRAEKVSLNIDEPVDVMVDGEVTRLQLQTLEVLPSALEVLA